MSGKSTQDLMLNALKEIKTLKRQLAAYEKAAHEPIAIIGMGCRYPGQSVSPAEFWNKLYNGVDCITQQENNERWNMDDLYDPNPDAPGKIYSKGLGIIERPDMFDAEFFGVSPREAEDIDPQHRILLEVCHEAMEDAGYAPSRLNGSKTGVFVGIASSDYAHLGSMLGSADKLTPWQGIGNAASAAPCRISYLYNLKGPALGIDTACSSSLVALHFACQSLRNRECDAAFSGGVHLVLNPAISIVFAKARMLSADGKCKTFDAAADGYVRSEGCGVVMLKRLSDAIADGDNILALIKGTAINQDGKSQGFTAPNETAQEEVIRAALQQAQLEPAQVSYVEAHGTGTPLGDPIELGALNSVYCAGQNRRHPLLVGSAKTNIGHSEAAAGAAGLVKLVLSLQHRTIPPHIHYKTPNPYIPWSKMAIQVTDKLTQWDNFAAPDGKLRAGLSSFAFTGTNAHIILEEYKPEPATESPTAAAPWVPSLVLTSAKQPLAVSLWQDALKNHMDVNTSLTVAQIARTCAAGRDHYKFRTALLPQSAEHLKALLVAKKGEGVLTGVKQKPKYKIAFVFSGQGAQFAGMGRAFHEHIPAFRNHFDQVAAQLNPLLDVELTQLLWGEHSDKLDQTRYTQPALFALEYALAKTWMQWGVKPDCVSGHSVGEITAACIAGVFSLADACKLIVARAQLMGATAQGAMLVVFANEAKTRTLIQASPGLEICAVNGPLNTVVGGDPALVDALEAQLAGQDIQFRRLPVQHAFHTAAMDSALKPFAEKLNGIAFTSPRMRIYSNLNGEHVGKQMAEADYWVQQIRQPVQFMACAKSIIDAQCDLVLEVGPGTALIAMLQEVASSLRAGGQDVQSLATVGSLQKKMPALDALTRSLAQLYVAGLDLDWAEIMPLKQVAAVELPTYPFQRKSFWNETLREALTQQDLPDKARNWLYQMRWDIAPALPVADKIASAKRWVLLFPTTALAEQFAGLLPATQSKQCGSIAIENGQVTLNLNGTREILPADGSASPWLASALQGSASEPVRLVVSLAQLPLVATAADYDALTALFLALAKTLQTVSHCNLSIITEAAQGMKGQQAVVRADQAVVLGFAKNLLLEMADRMQSTIDVEDWTAATAQLCANALQAAQPSPLLSVRQNQLLTPSLLRVEGDRLSQRKLNLDANKFYVVAGGTGAIGLAVANWLAGKGALHIALLSRNGARGDDAQQQIETLRKNGVQVVVPAVDLADRAALDRVLQSLRAEHPIAGVIHAAGQFELVPVGELTTARCSQLMANKVLGLQWLDELCADDKLEFFAGFSSIASVWGSAGNFHYSAANQAVDAIIQRRRQQGKPALAINWGPWAESGMVSDESGAQAAKRGLLQLEKNIGVQTFGRLLGSDEIQITVADIQWNRFKPLMSMLPVGALFNRVNDLNGDVPAEVVVELNQEDLAFKEELATCAPEERADRLLVYLRHQLARALQLNALEVDDTQPLIDMGIDSLLAVEFKNRVTQVTQVELPVVRLLGGASLRDVAKWMAEGYGDLNQADQPVLDDEQALVEGVL
ncbi:MAG: SDR family NAD(P)-dependent oxidoreductase [Gammaproteobacteria bacterium]|nr:SDR family NAD(P)-dependent oxidoreductase [Gammaproteobacteria bacterium]